MAHPKRMVEWVGVNWGDLEDEDIVWVRRASGNFEAVGPFIVVSVYERLLQSAEGVVFTHREENLLKPSDYASD